ncbi:hypothetical protein ACS0TY_026540 [Phlomoides rotata]
MEHVDSRSDFAEKKSNTPSIVEFVSVYSPLDIEVAQMKTENKKATEIGVVEEGDDGESEGLPNPVQAVATSALAFSIGAMVPLKAASFIGEYKLSICSIVAAVSGTLVAFGWLGAALGRAPVVRLTVRVVVAETKLNTTEFLDLGTNKRIWERTCI